jgi:AraC-like DNA-binding protein
MSQAKRWLAETSLPIRVIADKLAFCSEFYFMRAFKRETGITPGAWRKKDRNLG